MKRILALKRYYHVATVSIFLVAIVLIAGLAGCGGIVKYDLTIASTTGGLVSNPGEGTFPYDEGEVVTLLAEAAEGR